MGDRAVVAAAVSFLMAGLWLSDTEAPDTAQAVTDPPPAAHVDAPEASRPVATPVTKPIAVATPPSVSPAAVQASPSPSDPEVPQPQALLTFRGNATRTFHGTGPIGQDATTRWSYPSSQLCSDSTVGNETTQWCGTGWTGQPAVVQRDGRTWVIVGAYDRAVHFIDADTGQAIIPPFVTGDIIKGSVTVDPDGYPIVYSGSRDGNYRAIAFDGPVPRELWSLSAADATGPTLWNDDWDGAGLIIDNHLVVGGENSRLFVARLDRGYDPDGMVTLSGQVVADVAGWDDELLGNIGDRNVSIEGSVAIHDGVVYFANSGGLVQGWDLASLTAPDSEPQRVFRWWSGDDTDATVVIDPADGHLIVASEWERHTDRSRAVGQVVRLDPLRTGDPVVWNFTDPAAAAGVEIAGVWATPALWKDLVIVPTTSGTLSGLDAQTGEPRWSLDLGDHLWSSPVVVDDVLIQGDCSGTIHAFDLTPTGAPAARWTLALEGCVESTPAVWNGQLFVGTRAGRIVAADIS
ncbi:hypothetical protein BH24ACT15_BH24ACT15_18410 [soil metagenome]